MVTPPTEPFEISKALHLVAEAVKPYPRAAMFELAEQGFATPFQQLVACIISIRTRDEESLPASLRLFDRRGIRRPDRRRSLRSRLRS